MRTRIKRTYNLDAGTVRAVREMAENRVASSQDAVIELAVDELQRRLRDERESAAWDAASKDPMFMAEARDFGQEYRTADDETWPG